jgi:hypothetical protein
VQWEVTVTPPHGRTELERLSDVDSAVIVSGQNVYAVGFQGKVAMLALDTGQVWWSHEASSARGMSIDADTLYVPTSDGEILALHGRSGQEVWRQTALLYRRLSARATWMGLVVGDYQGYVDWFDKASGAIIARVLRKAREQRPGDSGNLAAIVNDRGQVTVYRVTALAAAGKNVSAAATSPETAPAQTTEPPRERARPDHMLPVIASSDGRTAKSTPVQCPHWHVMRSCRRARPYARSPVRVRSCGAGALHRHRHRRARREPGRHRGADARPDRACGC